jgi:DNA-directed RNA polymerase specialized sigma54-like protein
LGGIYSHSLIDGNLKYSEASNKAVAQFMIYISKAKNTNTKEIKASQEDFYQPLKYKLINYVINDSAAKNGVNKINPRERFFDNNPLEYTTLSTLKYGIQQDSDHEADEAELTEMTQVISALDATGYYHDEIYDIYNAIGEQIISSLELEYNALKDPNPSKLYDLVGKTIINNFSDRKGMVKAVLD